MMQRIFRFIGILLLVCLIFGVIFIGVPMIINYVIGTSNPTSITLHGQQTGWHNFWSVYLGALIGAIVPFIILYKTLSNNKYENTKNREIQINSIKFQTQISWINQLRDAIATANDLFSFSIQDKFLHQNDPNISNSQLLSELFENANRTKRKFVSVLYGVGTYEDDFLKYLDEFCKRYWCYLFDLDFFSKIKNCTSSDAIKSEVESYKLRTNSFEYSRDRIWHIIEERHYGTNSQDLSYYINELSRRYPFQDFENRCLKLIQYETNIANDILNGTETK